MRYIFNTSGDYVAFLKDSMLFSPAGEWIGFAARANEIYRKDGSFLGYLTDDDRIISKRGETKLRKLPPIRPTRPLLPIRPLRRLRMPNLPAPLQDEFEDNRNKYANQPSSYPNLDHLKGAEIVASDGTFLGQISKNRFHPNSIANPYGQFGSRYNSNSIFNRYGNYGSKYSQTSPFNRYAQAPPKITRAGKTIGYLTRNPHWKPQVDPGELLAWASS